MKKTLTLTQKRIDRICNNIDDAFFEMYEIKEFWRLDGYD